MRLEGGGSLREKYQRENPELITLIDNYDSFSYNLFQYVSEVVPGREIKVIRNDQISVEEIVKNKPEHIILSPGPCTPNESGIGLELVRSLAGEIPLLGVCLGYQTIAQALGGRVVRAKVPVHGKQDLVEHDSKGIFKNLSSPLEVARYHSLIVEDSSLPREFEVSARSQSSGEIMAIRHKNFPSLVGLQFHPESILTPEGKILLKNFFSPA